MVKSDFKNASGLRPLSPLLQEKAQKELNEDPNSIASDILAIREWLVKQPHLQSVNPSDQWIISFLRGNKFSLEKTKSKLDMYYTLRTMLPDIYGDRNPFNPTVQGILKLGIFLPLVSLEAENSCRISVQPFKAVEKSNFSLVEIYKVIFMLVDILILEDDNFAIAGMDLVVDLDGVGMRTFSQFTPAMAKKSVAISEKALPLRMRSTHLLHAPTGFETAYSILQMFISEKWKKRFKVHSKNFETLYEFIPRKLLPKEYGGECGTVQELIDYWKAKVESYSEWFHREELVCSDEALRPGAAKTSSALFGIEGSFRKLNVD